MPSCKDTPLKTEESRIDEELTQRRACEILIKFKLSGQGFSKQHVALILLAFENLDLASTKTMYNFLRSDFGKEILEDLFYSELSPPEIPQALVDYALYYSSLVMTPLIEQLPILAQTLLPHTHPDNSTLPLEQLLSPKRPRAESLSTQSDSSTISPSYLPFKKRFKGSWESMVGEMSNLPEPTQHKAALR